MLNKKENLKRAYEDPYPKISIGSCKSTKNTNVHIAKKIWQQAFAIMLIAIKDSIIHVECNTEEKCNFTNQKRSVQTSPIGQNPTTSSNKTEKSSVDSSPLSPPSTSSSPRKAKNSRAISHSKSPSPRKIKNTRSTSPSRSPTPRKIKSTRAKITEEILIDSESENDDQDESTNAAITDNNETGSKIVQKPFRLFNPKTQESFVMKVAPLPFFELSPSLEGLNLQVHETLEKYHQSQTAVKSPTPDDEEKLQQLPKIGAPFSLAPLGKSNDIIDLCDSG